VEAFEMRLKLKAKTVVHLIATLKLLLLKENLFMPMQVSFVLKQRLFKQ
jgi:hypothetical protein